MTYQHRAEVSRPSRKFTPRAGCACKVSDGRTITRGTIVDETDIAYRENRSRMTQVHPEHARRWVEEPASAPLPIVDMDEDCEA